MFLLIVKLNAPLCDMNTHCSPLDLQEVFSALSTQQTIKIPTSTMAHLSKSYGLDV